MLNSKIKLTIFLMILFWQILIFSDFLTFFWGGFSYLSIFFNFLFSSVCHQNPQKLIYIGDLHTNVCARCMGIYSGTFLISALYLFKAKIINPQFRIFLISLILMALHVFLIECGIIEYDKISALFTGILLGVVVSLYLHLAIINFLLEKKKA